MNFTLILEIFFFLLLLGLGMMGFEVSMKSLMLICGWMIVLLDVGS